MLYEKRQHLTSRRAKVGSNESVQIMTKLDLMWLEKSRRKESRRQRKGKSTLASE
jgi:hypothetical protein